MKNLKTLTVAVLALSLFSFTAMIDKKVNTEQSTVKWVGKKVTGQHEGTINLESGSLQFDGKTLTGGNFVIDMTTITVTDLEGKGKTNLEGHLKSDDFFGVTTYPTAKFEITKVVSRGKAGDYKVTGNLTIKETTKEIRFNATVDNSTGVPVATADITIDRSDFNVKYGSGSFFDNLGDKTIYDEFDLGLKLVGTK